MSEEIRKLTELCYKTQTDVAVLKESHGTTRTMLEKISQQLEVPKENKNMRTWHFVLITVCYGLISVMPHDKILEFLVKAGV